MRKLLVVLLIPCLQGCGVIYPALRSESKLSSIQFGQTRQEVLAAIGTPNVVRSAKKHEDGTIRQIDEYGLYRSHVWWVDALAGIPLLTIPWWMPWGGNASPYWLEYADGKLVQWGRPNDWKPDLSVDLTTRQR